jgi:hypothetical protein
MNKRHKKQDGQVGKSIPRPNIPKVILSIAKANLKEFEIQADEGFLIRAAMDRKLRSL